MARGRNEAFSRVLIDRALHDAGWDLLDPAHVLFEFNTANGRADYLLKDSLGRVLCVLEAKRPDDDPYDAKEQARGYAHNLKAPFIILSNGTHHWFWNFDRADERDAYRIERLPSREDLDRIRLRNLQPPRPLASEIVAPDYIRHLKHDLLLRRYQIAAMGRKPLPTRDAIIADTVDSIAARFNLRYTEQKWVDATAQLLVEDSAVLRRFMKGDMTIFTASQFNQLGGVAALAGFDKRVEVFEALRQSILVQQSLLAVA